MDRLEVHWLLLVALSSHLMSSLAATGDPVDLSHPDMGKDQPDMVVQAQPHEQDEQDEELEPGLQKLSFKPPQLSEEEERSPLIPDLQRCDGCFAVAHQFHLAFNKAHKNFKASRRLKESEVLDVVDSTCTSDVFNTYGISRDDERGVNRIKGPGVFDEAGVAQMGGRTPYRLAEVCGNLRDVDEMRIYTRWVTNGRSSDALKEMLCFEETTLCKGTYLDKDEL